ncbi:hypothetical protein [Nocardioides sp. TF02-7]|uniref:hypothetical protein n=1 Tax=Nocardioides sp. TF02-7 TaxID=2917724 RepID=UPI001F062AA4|nr:hypothetical protein [Nocardioides sp. TF02-7]UMG94357.1 hypothetical protein MF408_10340 [Nocardioides sp. TF02-7]
MSATRRALLLPGLLLAALLATGCRSDDEPPARDAGSTSSPAPTDRTETGSNPTSDATDPGDPSDAASGEATAETTEGATDGSSDDDPGPAERDLRTDLPTGLHGMCVAYAEMVDGVDAIDGGQDLDALAVEMTGVMKQWAAKVPGLERPQDMSAATWRGIGTLAERIRALPRRADDGGAGGRRERPEPRGAGRRRRREQLVQHDLRDLLTARAEPPGRASRRTAARRSRSPSAVRRPASRACRRPG